MLMRSILPQLSRFAPPSFRVLQPVQIAYRSFRPSVALCAKAKKTDDASKDAAATSKLSGKSSALEAAVKQVLQQYGKGALMKLGGNAAGIAGLDKNDFISTGSVGVDIALGTGGLPRGRVVEIYGPEASGKTTLALHVIAEAQKTGGKCVFIDAEHALDATMAKRIGVNIDDLYIAQPDNGEQALEIADTLVRSGGADVIVIDSVAALVPRAEVEGDMGDAHMALQARLMSQALRKLTHNLSKAQTLLIFINQIRHKVGVMFGSPEVTAGGNALKFYASVRLEIRKVGPLKQGDTIIGSRVKVKVAKNKLAAPFHQAEFDLLFGKGISRTGELVDLASQFNLLQKSGSWFSLNGVQIAQGRDRAKKYFEDNPEAAAQLTQQLKDTIATNPDAAAAAKELLEDAEEADATAFLEADGGDPDSAGAPAGKSK